MDKQEKFEERKREVLEKVEEAMEEFPFTGDRQNLLIGILKPFVEEFSEGEFRLCLRKAGFKLSG